MHSSYWLNTDNALGAPRGDIDDGYALVLARELKPQLVFASYGNTSRENSYRNTVALMNTIQSNTRIVHGALGPGSPEHVAEIVPPRTTYIDLGPLTQLAHLVTGTSSNVFQRVLLVGGRLESIGCFYPYWPHEFNFAKDPLATQAVFESHENINLIELPQARRLALGTVELNILRTAWPWLGQKSKRRYWRNFILKARACVILWDVVSIASELHPEHFLWDERSVICEPSGRIRQSQRGRKIQTLIDFDVNAVRKLMMESILSSHPCREYVEKTRSQELEAPDLP